MKLYHFILTCLLLASSCSDSSTTTNPNPQNSVTFSIGDTAAFEQAGESTLTFDINASEVLTSPTTIEYETKDLTAEAGSDYQQASGQITMAAGEQSTTIQVTILFDDQNEVDEALEVTISNSGQSSSPIGIIRDNDDPVYSESGYSTAESFAGYTLSWSDEFEGEQLDMNSYTFEMGDGCPNLCGWGNNELQFYRDDSQHTNLENGNLVITARQNGNGFNSSRIITKGKREFQYGRIDIRAKLPEGQGIWPAIWMLGSNIDEVGWPASGEIDIMEMVGHEPNRTHGTAHWGNRGENSTFKGSSITLPEKFSERFHVFTLVWQPNSLDWYVDEVKFNSLTPAQVNGSWRFNDPFFLIFNIAVGGNWPGSPDETTVFPQSMEIDYIRVFQ